MLDVHFVQFVIFCLIDPKNSLKGAILTVLGSILMIFDSYWAIIELKLEIELINCHFEIW